MLLTPPPLINKPKPPNLHLPVPKITKAVLMLVFVPTIVASMIGGVMVLLLRWLGAALKIPFFSSIPFAVITLFPHVLFGFIVGVRTVINVQIAGKAEEEKR